MFYSRRLRFDLQILLYVASQKEGKFGVPLITEKAAKFDSFSLHCYLHPAGVGTRSSSRAWSEHVVTHPPKEANVALRKGAMLRRPMGVGCGGRLHLSQC